MHENRFNEYRIPSGMLIVFLEKALTLIHMETHLDDVSTHSAFRSNYCLALSAFTTNSSFLFHHCQVAVSGVKPPNILIRRPL